MKLLDITLSNFLVTVSERDLSLNTDIFEANLINLIILGGAIFYFLGDALSTNLIERKKNILRSIQEAEEQLSKASYLYSESRLRSDRIPFIIENINLDGNIMIKKVKNVVLTNGILEIIRLEASVKAETSRVEAVICKTISENAVKEALKQIKLQLNDVKLKQKLMDEVIYNL